MPSARRFSSSLIGATLAVAALALSGCAADTLGGISTQAGALDAPLPPSAQAATQRTAKAAAAPATTETATAAATPAEKRLASVGNAAPSDPGVDASIRTASTGSQPDTSGPRSRESGAWCRYLAARAAARNAILLSPTVSGSVDNDGSATARVAFDLVDIRRAGLERRTAEAACEQYDAAGRISRMLLISPQSLTYSGNFQKAEYLASSRGELAAIERQIDGHVAAGEMTSQIAVGLQQYIETIRSLEHHARSEAHRRQTIGRYGNADLRDLDQRLIEAERVIERLNREQRTLDAMSVTVSAGVNRRDGQDGSVFNDDSAYARLSFSYRLGAASPVRHSAEDEAERARIDALTEDGLGVLWRSREMADALVRAREGLQVERDALARAVSEAKRNATKVSAGYDLELLPIRYRSRVDIIKLTADLRGIDGMIDDIEKLAADLRFR